MPEFYLKTNIGPFSAGATAFRKGITREIYNSADAVRTFFRKETRGLFQSQGASGKHGSWPPLSDHYAAWKARRYPGQGIMVLSGALRDSLTSQTDGSTYRVSRSGNRFYINIGTDVKSKDGFDYPRHHQERAAKRRRVIDPKSSTWNRWAQILQNGVIIQSRSVFDNATATRNARVKGV